MVDITSDGLFQGRGRKLDPYAVKEANWPELWRMPDAVYEGAEDGGVMDKVTVLADDLLLRTSINIWDNCIRAPGAAEGVLAGMLSAMARFMTVLRPDATDEDLVVACREISDGLYGQLLTWRAVNRDGWHASEIED